MLTWRAVTFHITCIGVQVSTNGPNRAGHVGVEFKGSMWIFGGEDMKGNYTNEMWKFDIAANKWSKVAQSGDIPSPRTGHAAAIINDSMLT